MIEGFLIGLSNTLCCVGVCAPILLPFMLAQNKKPLIPILYFLLGRFLAYMFFAFCGGLMSIYFEGRVDPYIFSVLTMVMALWMILYSFGRLNLHFSFCRLMGEKFSGKNFPLFAGFVMGVNICPPFLLGLSEVLQMGSILSAMLFFTGFYLGSSLWPFLFLWTPKISKYSIIPKIGSCVSILVGLWFLWKGVASLVYFLF